MKNFLPAIAFVGLAALGTPAMFASVDASLMGPGTTYAEPEAEYEFYAQLTNKGTEAITQLTYTQSIDGYETKEFTIDLPVPLEVGAKRYIALKGVAPDEVDLSYTMKLKVTAVNGTAVTKTAVSGKVMVSSFVPKHRPVVEDYTGTWCGYCPQGWVAMEAIRRDYPGVVLGIAYHSGDPMAVAGFSVPQQTNYAPTMRVNRSTNNPDDTGNAQSCATTALRSINTLAGAAVTMEKAEWLDDSQCDAYAKVSVEFPNTISDNEFQVEFVLIEDGLSGSTSSWKQHNYFKGQAGWADDLWDVFSKGGEYVVVDFNDVCIANTLKSGSDFESAVPGTPGRTKLTFEYTFKDVDMIKEYGSSKNYILQNPDKCHIAAIVSKRSSKAVVNCDWLPVANASGILDVISDSAAGESAEKEYFTISGVKVASDNLAPGLYIVKEGNHASKVVIR